MYHRTEDSTAYILDICISQNPVQVAIHASVDTRATPLSAADAPGHDADRDPALVGKLYQQRTSAIALTGVLTSFRKSSAHGSVRNVLYK